MTEPTDALIPCPFCGSPDVAIADDLVTFNGLCNACGASGGYSSYRNGATWLWNRRTTQPTQAQAGAVPLIQQMLNALQTCQIDMPGTRFKRAVYDEHAVSAAITAAIAHMEHHDTA